MRSGGRAGAGGTQRLRHCVGVAEEQREVAHILQGLISNKKCCLNDFLQGRTLLYLTKHLAK